MQTRSKAPHAGEVSRRQEEQGGHARSGRSLWTVPLKDGQASGAMKAAVRLRGGGPRRGRWRKEKECSRRIFHFLPRSVGKDQTCYCCFCPYLVSIRPAGRREHVFLWVCVHSERLMSPSNLQNYTTTRLVGLIHQLITQKLREK